MTFFEKFNDSTVFFFQHAQKSFQDTFTNCKQRLAAFASKLGRCVERARPYYDACKQAKEVEDFSDLHC